MAATIATEGDSTAADHIRSRRYALWTATALAVGAIIVGIALWLGFSGGDELPTLTFTGDTVIYDGPTSFDERLITFKLENKAEDFATFAWGLTEDDSITWEDLVAWTEAHADEPPWLKVWQKIDTIGPDRAGEATVLVMEGTIDLVAWNAERGWRTYAAARLEVTGN